MATTINRKFEKAQSMVEFALVLPILLLIVVGIIGFGHLFFVYSSAVSASREAARYGAAVGVSPRGMPRYQDCAGIRDAAARVGSFAGVTPATVTITYDGGPGGTTVGNCPVGGTGPDVDLGDRIVVSITVQYRSIVPLVNIPNFPITAETKRTVVRSLEIGAAPTAASVCPDTVTRLIFEDDTEMVGDPNPNKISVKVDQPLALGIVVESTTGGGNPSNGSSLILRGVSETAADNSFNLNDATKYDAPGGPKLKSLTSGFRYATVSDDVEKAVLISGYYTGDYINCFTESYQENALILVEAAATQLSIDALPPSVPTGARLPVNVHLEAQFHNEWYDWAGKRVTVTNQTDGQTCSITLSNDGRGSCELSMNTTGPNVITARFDDLDVNTDGFPEYNGSDAPEQTVDVIEPTLIIPPTRTPRPNNICPSFSEATINPGERFFQFKITNNNPYDDEYVSKVTLNWPFNPVFSLQDVRLDVPEKVGNTCTHSPDSERPDCLFSSGAVVRNNSTPMFSIGEGGVNGSIIHNDARVRVQYQEIMRFVFDQNLTGFYGPYSATVEFESGCQFEVSLNY